MENKSLIFSKVLGDARQPALIMLHGWGHSHESLLPMAEILEKYFFIHLIDLPGFGNTPLPEEAKNRETAWDTQQYTLEVVRYMDQNGIKSASILGHSFGGRLCLRLASGFADRIESVVLIDSAGLKRVRSRKEQMRMRKIKLAGKTIFYLKPAIGKKLYERLIRHHREKFGSEDYKNAGELRHVLVKTVNEDQKKNAAAIINNTLILWGELDTATPLYMGVTLHKLIKNSTLIVMKHKGHEPFVGLGAHLCAYHIINFFKAKSND